MDYIYFIPKLIFVDRAQRSNSKKGHPLRTCLSPIHLEYTHLEPGRGPHSMRSQFQFWPRIDEDKSEDMKITVILLMSMWLHQTPQGSGVISVECDVHDAVQHF